MFNPNEFIFLGSLPPADLTRLTQVLFRTLWVSEPEPPSVHNLRFAVQRLRARLKMNQYEFALYCHFSKALACRLEGEGIDGAKTDDLGGVIEYASSSPGVFRLLASIAREACYPKHAAYFERQAQLAVERSHAPRRGVAR